MVILNLESISGDIGGDDGEDKVGGGTQGSNSDVVARLKLKPCFVDIYKKCQWISVINGIFLIRKILILHQQHHSYLHRNHLSLKYPWEILLGCLVPPSDSMLKQHHHHHHHCHNNQCNNLPQFVMVTLNLFQVAQSTFQLVPQFLVEKRPLRWM